MQSCSSHAWYHGALSVHDLFALRAAILTHVHKLNAGFSELLAASEARDIAHSIHKWITTCSRMWAEGPAAYEATFSTIQAARAAPRAAISAARA